MYMYLYMYVTYMYIYVYIYIITYTHFLIDMVFYYFLVILCTWAFGNANFLVWKLWMIHDDSEVHCHVFCWETRCRTPVLSSYHLPQLRPRGLSRYSMLTIHSCAMLITSTMILSKMFGNSESDLFFLRKWYWIMVSIIIMLSINYGLVLFFRSGLFWRLPCEKSHERNRSKLGHDESSILVAITILQWWWKL
jgi:hypothetical protein